MPRQSIFETHAEGAKILRQLIAKDITQTKAAEKLGCTVANVSTYLKKMHMSRQKQTSLKSDLKTTLDETVTSEEIQELLVEFNTDLSLDEAAPLGFRFIFEQLYKALILLGHRNLETKEFMLILRELRQLLEFQVKNPLPDLKQTPIMIEPGSEKLLVDELKGFCNECPYYNEFLERKTNRQNKLRLEPKQSTSLGKQTPWT